MENLFVLGAYQSMHNKSCLIFWVSMITKLPMNQKKHLTFLIIALFLNVFKKNFYNIFSSFLTTWYGLVVNLKPRSSDPLDKNRQTERHEDAH